MKAAREAAKLRSRKTAGTRHALPIFSAAASPVAFESYIATGKGDQEIFGMMRRNDQRGTKLLLRERRIR